MSCPSEPIPAGWRAWRGNVPPELGQFAVDVLRRISGYSYGTVAQVIVWQGAQVGAFKSHHTWTFRNGRLITGLCIPGVSLVVPTSSPLGLGTLAVGADLSTPDASLAVYTIDEPPERTDWRLVTATAVAILGVSAAFALALRQASFARRSRLRS